VQDGVAVAGGPEMLKLRRRRRLRSRLGRLLAVVLPNLKREASPDWYLKPVFINLDPWDNCWPPRVQADTLW
jgi:hypothetical protein